MEEGSFLRSLDRVEAALTRVEAAARNRPPAPAPEPDDADLKQRHLALKTAVGQALSRLDDLIASQA
jgi:hypothetical protein